MPFDQAWIDLAPQTASFERNGAEQAATADLRLIASLLDLTSLNTDDTEDKVQALFGQAIEALPGVPAAGVCVFPQFLSLAGTWVRARGVRLVTVAGDFPHALGALLSRCDEVSRCAKLADEVDVPLRRGLALEERWEELYFECCELVRAAHGASVKMILGTGELPNQRSIYRVATVALMSGATFLKTSTGKERINARLDAGAIMCRAIRDYAKRTGFEAGIKPAGGIRSVDEAMQWVQLVKTKLGDEWITPQRFRIGASTLLEHLRFSFADG